MHLTGTLSKLWKSFFVLVPLFLNFLFDSVQYGELCSSQYLNARQLVVLFVLCHHSSFSPKHVNKQSDRIKTPKLG